MWRSIRSSRRAASSTSTSPQILRLGPNGTIPKDNPFGNTPVYVLGIRNTQGFDWLDDGRLVVTDHGPSVEATTLTLGLLIAFNVTVLRRGLERVIQTR